MSRGAYEYWKVHRAVKDIHGPAKLHDCAFCSRDAHDWAYNHRDSNEGVAKYNSCAYSNDPNFYIPLCRPCHRRFDKKHRRGGEESPPWLLPKPVRLWEFRRIRFFR
jgi:hypothetical protein